MQVVIITVSLHASTTYLSSYLHSFLSMLTMARGSCLVLVNWKKSFEPYNLTGLVKVELRLKSSFVLIIKHVCILRILHI